jgi:heme-degrading monooxygenase HmoA
MVDRPWTVVAAPAGDREYLALISYPPLKRFRMIPRFLRYSGLVSTQLEGTRGLVGFAFRAKILARECYTLSVWEDERALDEFVRAEPHRGTMGTMRPQMAETKFVRWTLKGSQVPPSWREAIEVLRSG